MSSNLGMKVLAGAIALALGGTAMANTTLDGTGTGDLFLNIVDNTNHTSLLFDTGISQASFTGTTSLTPENVASEANYASFFSAVGSGDSLDYSVMSATKTSGSPATGNIYFTSNVNGVAPIIGANVSQAQGAIASFVSVADVVTSGSSKSVVLNSANYWGETGAEGITATNLLAIATGTQGAIGAPLAFYSDLSSSLRSASALSTLTTFAGTWDLTSAGLLSYTVAGGGGTPPVPVPPSLLLLLSGLGLTAVLARRGKSSSSGFASNAAAA